MVCSSPRPSLRALSPLILSLLVGVGVGFGTPSAVQARVRPDRSGGQAEFVSGVSACIPGAADCKSDTGHTAPMVGMSINAGYRLRPTLFAGIGYSGGFYSPKYEIAGGNVYRTAYQQGLFVVLRGILPLGRLDLGLELSPGVSRVVFRPDTEIDIKHYSQGFALRPGVSADVWLGRQVFVGVKADLVLNLHRNACTRIGDRSTCEHKQSMDNVAVHQLIAGVHLGGTF